jgi:hypothetical protein
MTLKQLLAKATDKERFSSIEAYVEFARVFLGYVVDHIQATIVLQNEPHYHFWQYQKDVEGLAIAMKIPSSGVEDLASAAEKLISDMEKLVGSVPGTPNANTLGTPALLCLKNLHRHPTSRPTCLSMKTSPVSPTPTMRRKTVPTVARTSIGTAPPKSCAALSRLGRWSPARRRLKLRPLPVRQNRVLPR